MNYNYSYSYKDLATGEIVSQSVNSNEKLTLDDIFLNTFVFLIEKNYPAPFGGHIEYEGSKDYVCSISELRGDSAIHFEKMEFKLISGQQNLKRSLGFAKKS